MGKKKNMKIAELKEVAPGIAGNDKTLKMLKRLGIDPAELIKKNSSGLGRHYQVKKKTKKKTKTA
tara:strand:- start:41 stop:235 length:195 start_codon:yes stop_codon:yes gene_type:complete